MASSCSCRGSAALSAVSPGCSVPPERHRLPDSSPAHQVAFLHSCGGNRNSCASRPYGNCSPHGRRCVRPRCCPQTHATLNPERKVARNHAAREQEIWEEPLGTGESRKMQQTLGSSAAPNVLSQEKFPGKPYIRDTEERSLVVEVVSLDRQTLQVWSGNHSYW